MDPASHAHGAGCFCRALLVVALLVALIARCAPAAARPGRRRRAGRPPRRRASRSARLRRQPLRRWTFMVYLDGDNNLDPWG